MKASPAAAICCFALFAAFAGSAEATPPKKACEVLPAAQVSKIIGQTVTERVMETPSNPGGVCMYSAGRPVLQFGVTTYESADLAAKNLKALGTNKKTAARQKGTVIVSAIAMNGDASKLAALLDAAMQNL